MAIATTLGVALLATTGVGVGDSAETVAAPSNSPCTMQVQTTFFFSLVFSYIAMPPILASKLSLNFPAAMALLGPSS